VDEVNLAQAELRQALAGASEPSEAALLSRLYWWTAEYGLVGRPVEYKLYGAGLLSSLGESHSCHDPSVRKLVLDERCVDVPYDITQPQPQLFVAPSFDALHDVLDRVARKLSLQAGGEVALGRALRSGEVASVRFLSGASVIGVLREVGGGLSAPSFLRFEGRVAFAWDGRILPGLRPLSGLAEHCVVAGRLHDGTPLELASDATLAARLDASSGKHRFRFDRGAAVEGRVLRCIHHPDGRLMVIELGDARLTLPGTAPRDVPHYALLATGDALTAHAGAVDATYHADTPFSLVRVPRRRDLPAGERAVLDLYERAQGAFRAGPRAMADAFSRVHALLERDHPREWLLRWNMLESLLKVMPADALVPVLRGDLERIELALDGRQPVASGLRYLHDVYPPPSLAVDPASGAPLTVTTHA